jgi:lipoyl(octanoyl) transferase
VRTRTPGPASQLRAAADEPVTVIDRTGGAPVPYRLAWRWQRDLVARRAVDEIGDTVLLLEHRPTYTMGTQADRGHLLLDEEALAAHGIEVVDVDRGGDITYHGPGQLVGYPIVALDGPRVVDHVRALEELNIRLLAEHGLSGERVEGYTGVWVGDEKVTAIGVRVSTARWVTQHGWATNVAPSMLHWKGIVACGISDPDRTVGSLASLGVESTVADTAARTTRLIGQLYEAEVDLRTAMP